MHPGLRPGLQVCAATRRKGGEKERMRTERNANKAGAEGSIESSTEKGNAESTADPTPTECGPDQFLLQQDAIRHAALDWAGASRLAAQAPPPEIRDEKIAAIQNALAQGTYQVSCEQTAEAIISEQQVRDGTAA